MVDRWRGYAAVLGAVLIHLTLGSVYSWGNLQLYVTSYMRNQGHSVHKGSEAWVLALSITGQAASMMPGGALQRRFGARFPVALGSLLMSAACVASSYWAVNAGFFPFALTYGLCFGVGIGLCYSTAMQRPLDWFPENRGVVAGVVVGGFGAGALVFDFVQTGYINPHDVKPSDHGYFSAEDLDLEAVPRCLRVLAACYVLMQFVGTLLLFEPPAESAASSQAARETQTQMLGRESAPVNMPPKLMLRQKSFWFLWLDFLLLGMSVLFTASFFKKMGQETGAADEALSAIGSISSAFNAGGRIFSGKMCDRFGFKTAAFLVAAPQAALMLTYSFAANCGFIVYAVWTCLLFFSLGGCFAIFPFACSRCFGPEHFAANYGLMFSCNAVASPLAAALSSVLTSTLGTSGMTFVIGGILVLATIAVWLTPEVPDIARSSCTS